MNEGELRMQAQIASLTAEMYGYVAQMEGMKAENTFRELNGENIFYGEDAFCQLADKLHVVAKALRSQ